MLKSLHCRRSTTHICQHEPQVPRIRGVSESRTNVQDAGTDEFLDLAIEMLHAISVAICHRFQQRLAILFAFFYIIAGAKR
jgi:hypothetical protein